MLDRQFLSTAGISASEFARWVRAEKHALTPFEARLFKAAEAAEIITGGDNASYSLEELRDLIDLGVIATNRCLYGAKDFERTDRIVTAATDLISSYNGNAADTLGDVLDELKKFAKNARNEDRRRELNELIEQLEDVIDYLGELEAALDS